MDPAEQFFGRPTLPPPCVGVTDKDENREVATCHNL
jgi:hypothetical protein